MHMFGEREMWENLHGTISFMWILSSTVVHEKNFNFFRELNPPNMSYFVSILIIFSIDRLLNYLGLSRIYNLLDIVMVSPLLCLLRKLSLKYTDLFTICCCIFIRMSLILKRVSWFFFLRIIPWSNNGIFWSLLVLLRFIFCIAVLT